MSRKFPAGVATGSLVTEIFDYAKEKQFALPAANVTKCTCNHPVFQRRIYLQRWKKPE
jgi:hypothetical protein